jgi:hypothetical protein
MKIKINEMPTITECYFSISWNCATLLNLKKKKNILEHNLAKEIIGAKGTYIT